MQSSTLTSSGLLVIKGNMHCLPYDRGKLFLQNMMHIPIICKAQHLLGLIHDSYTESESMQHHKPSLHC